MPNLLAFDKQTFTKANTARRAELTRLPHRVTK